MQATAVSPTFLPATTFALTRLTVYVTSDLSNMYTSPAHSPPPLHQSESLPHTSGLCGTPPFLPLQPPLSHSSSGCFFSPEVSTFMTQNHVGNNLTIPLSETEREEQTKPKVSRRKEIKSRSEWNRDQAQTLKIYVTTSWFVEKIFKSWQTFR